LLRYGIFDWLEDRGGPLAETFEDRLRMLEHADGAGFYAYHVAEHQGTPLSLDNSPAVFLSAASQRTSRLRLSALVFCLPWYDPLRLYNEICMLDQLSRGRLEVGIGRGVSPIESAYYGVTSPDQAREMSKEALDVLIEAFTHDELTYEGKHHRYDGVGLYNKPYQDPYPPLWYPTSNIESVPFVARHAFNTSHNFAANEVAKPHLALYWEEWAKHRNDAGRLNGHVAEPLVSNTRHIYVAPTDSEAIEEATPAFDLWSQHISFLSGRFSDRPRDSLALQRRMDNKTALIGSPETVRALVQEMLDETAINYFIGVFNFGNLPLERVLRSMDLFVKEVVPGLKESTTVPLYGVPGPIS
jgi:alkanesulfonate monooxygenase SsuD/methylene tetrahydromethanopterin reductase-like flavin-dependent oxidoreductase (luciferase family)